MRQAMPPDPDLTFATRVLLAPVVQPRRPETGPAVTVSEAARAENPAPPSAVTLWEPPVPTFTYLAGAAGSGKTFATREWAERDRGLVLCATTGIAAINLGGETINSVLGYFDTASLQESYVSGFLTAKLGKLWKSGVRRIVLDEVSMLAGDQLTFLVKAIEEVNGRGYVLGTTRSELDEDEPPQMGLTLVGDFLQLAPVKATYAFESPEWARFTPHIITLTDIRRQADQDFIDVLRAARGGRGQRVVEYFQRRNAIHQETDDRFDGPTILAKNESVDRYNFLRLAQVRGAEVTFPSARWGKQRSEWGNPDKPVESWGIPKDLKLRIGALVMVLANYRTLSKELLYVNGDLGTLREVSKDGREAWVELQRTGEVVAVQYVERLVKVPCDSARRKELREKGQHDKIDGKWEITGDISYMPLRVAYASTVHKSQGLSLDKVQVNVRDPFFKTPGMLYVALSRSRSAEGLRLVGSPAALIERCVYDPRLKGWL
jgi:ATP-dependent DNA helicase PIF1